MLTIPSKEHQTRSSDCRFFNFATKPTAKRSRKGRTSNSSRLSTQSNVTTLSEAPSIPDLDISIDQSIMSDVSVANSTVSTSKKSKKPSKARGSAASTRSKRGKKEQQIEINSSLMEIDVQEESQAAAGSQQTGQGRKRKSDEMSVDERSREDRESTVKPQQPSKRRATRNSVAERQGEISVLNLDLHSDDGALTEGESLRTAKKGTKATKKKGGRKRASSTTRKASVASKASIVPAIPRDSDIEAALEADLDKQLTDDEEGQQAVQVQPKAENRPRARGTSVSIAVSRKGKAKVDESQEEVLELADVSEGRAQDLALIDPQRMPTRPTRGSALTMATGVMRGDGDLDSSMVTPKTIEDDSGHESDASMASKSIIRKGSKKKAGSIRKGKGKKVAQGAAKNGKAASQEVSMVDEASVVVTQDHTATDEPSAEPPRPKQTPELQSKPKRAPKGSKNKPRGPDAETQDSSILNHESHAQFMLMSSPAKQTAPSPSPQHSDVENQPPSTRPSRSRPPVFSPLNQQMIRVPLAPSTPTISPSKRNATGSLQSSHPWKAVDLENVFWVANKDKENATLKPLLTSPEKRMTVEEWVSWNAQKGEDNLRGECERLVSIFEREGGRAMRTLETIECIE
jgi:hypothetical protein